MRHWVCSYCGTELMYESPERLHTQSAYHLVDNHLDRIVESLAKYTDDWDCQEEEFPESLEDSGEVDDASAATCERCGRNHVLWWAKVQAYDP